LESGIHGVLKFVHVLDGLGGINETVGTGVFGTEVPEFLSGLTLIPLVFLGEILRSLLGVVLGTNLSLFDIFGEIFGKGNGLGVNSVVLIG
jgi:hypothetical protein